jgi:hypothetical protein
MNQFAQSTVITAISDRAAKGTVDAPANRTSPHSLFVALRVGRKHALAANGTNLAAHRMDADQASGTDRQPGNIQQGLAANAAVGRKQNREQTLANSANPSSANPGSANRRLSRTGRSFVRWRFPWNNGSWNNRRPHYCDAGMVSPDVVLTTAEDGLLVMPRAQICRGQSFLYPLQYSGDGRP